MTQWEQGLEKELKEIIKEKTPNDYSYVTQYLIPIITKFIGLLPKEEYAKYKTTPSNG